MIKALGTPVAGSIFTIACVLFILYLIGSRGHTAGGRAGALIVSLVLIVVMRMAKGE